MIDRGCKKNVLELWKTNGEKLPFKVIRWTWNPATNFLVERVEIRKWPYGKAWGRFVRNGIADAASEQLSCAGNFQRKIVE
ncbi:MAG: hypothetical protein J0H60_09330 [Rhizobiales bacterium]|nr:hypothetical protein [Hyphomicrobiales bacterium]